MGQFLESNTWVSSCWYTEDFWVILFKMYAIEVKDTIVSLVLLFGVVSPYRSTGNSRTCPLHFG